MVNTMDYLPTEKLNRVGTLVAVYVVIAAVTLAALTVLSATGSAQATQDAWTHAVIVAVFAVLIPVRLRAARRGSARALKATGVIAAILFVVNIVEALIPNLFPLWMRVEMIGIAALMATVAVLVLRESR